MSFTRRTSRCLIMVGLPKQEVNRCYSRRSLTGSSFRTSRIESLHLDCTRWAVPSTTFRACPGSKLASTPIIRAGSARICDMSWVENPPQAKCAWCLPAATSAAQRYPELFTTMEMIAAPHRVCRPLPDPSQSLRSPHHLVASGPVIPK